MGALPKFKQIEYTTTLPLSGVVVKYRSYTVEDERNLIAISESKNEDPEFYVENTIKFIQKSVLNGVDISKLPSVDVRFLVLQMRSKSVGDEITATYGKEEIVFNIKDFYVENKKENKDYTIKIDNDVIFTMKDLDFGEEVRMTSGMTEENKNDLVFKLLFGSIKSIFIKKDANADEKEKELFVVGEDIKIKDVEEFVLQIPSNEAKPLYEFIMKMPVLAIDIMVGGEKKTITNRDVDFLSSQPTITQ